MIDPRTVFITTIVFRTDGQQIESPNLARLNAIKIDSDAEHSDVNGELWKKNIARTQSSNECDEK